MRLQTALVFEKILNTENMECNSCPIWCICRQFWWQMLNPDTVAFAFSFLGFCIMLSVIYVLDNLQYFVYNFLHISTSMTAYSTLCILSTRTNKLIAQHRKIVYYWVWTVFVNIQKSKPLTKFCAYCIHKYLLQHQEQSCSKVTPDAKMWFIQW